MEHETTACDSASEPHFHNSSPYRLIFATYLRRLGRSRSTTNRLGGGDGNMSIIVSTTSWLVVRHADSVSNTMHWLVSWHDSQTPDMRFISGIPTCGHIIQLDSQREQFSFLISSLYRLILRIDILTPLIPFFFLSKVLYDPTKSFRGKGPHLKRWLITQPSSECFPA